MNYIFSATLHTNVNSNDNYRPPSNTCSVANKISALFQIISVDPIDANDQPAQPTHPEYYILQGRKTKLAKFTAYTTYNCEYKGCSTPNNVKCPWKHVLNHRHVIRSDFA